MEDYLNVIDEDLWRSIRDGPFRASMVEVVGTAAHHENFIVTWRKIEATDKRYIRELRAALPPFIYNYIHGCKTAQKIWNTLKEKFQGNEHT